MNIPPKLAIFSRRLELTIMTLAIVLVGSISAICRSLMTSGRRFKSRAMNRQVKLPSINRRVKLSIIMLAIVVVGLGLALDSYGVIYSKVAVDSSGSIVTTVTYADPSSSTSPETQGTLKVYSDSACTVPVTAVNWGSIAPGGTTSQVVYLKNTANVPLTLSLTTANWNPTAAASSLVISWDKQATVLSAGQSVAATMTLSVASSVSGITTFSTQIIIAGTG
jgi:hypothetical protein